MNAEDRKLLEMAAKAAGIGPLDFDYPEREGHRFFLGPRLPMAEGEVMAAMWTYWNPLSDDGDEARLEAAVELEVRWQPKYVAVHQVWDGVRDRLIVETYADHNGDKQAARRRAGVHLAAAIGEAMPS